jgi:DNA (cytosine-5)-methyltransferase 1
MKNEKYKPWDDQKITACITKNGGKNRAYLTGKRCMTLDELAELQGFPNWFTFRGQKIKEQIGNAVSPSIAEVIFAYITKHLEDVDGICKSKEVGEMEER